MPLTFQTPLRRGLFISGPNFRPGCALGLGARVSISQGPPAFGCPDETIAQHVTERAQRLGAKTIVLPPDKVYHGKIGMPGDFQRRNAAIAELVLRNLPPAVRPDDKAIATGIASARLPGRFDRRGKWIFDVAHNPAGIATLVDLLRSSSPNRPIHALVGILDDKDWRGMIQGLRQSVEKMWITTPPTAPDNRRLDLCLLEETDLVGAVIEPDFDRALTKVQVGAETVVVAGSFHTVGDVMSRLPGFPPLG